VSHDLIATARRLAKASPKRPRQSDLKRGVSTAYYALFHALARDCADLLVGAGEARNDPAWHKSIARSNMESRKIPVRPLRAVDFRAALSLLPIHSSFCRKSVTELTTIRLRGSSELKYLF
jgi:hypothetical protein